MVPTRLAEPQVWAPTGITASGITTGTTGRPTTGRLDTGSTSSTVAGRPTSGTVRVLVRPTGSIVRVPQYEHLHRKIVQVLEFVQGAPKIKESPIISSLCAKRLEDRDDYYALIFNG